jgi:hypothetical protein
MKFEFTGSCCRKHFLYIAWLLYCILVLLIISLNIYQIRRLPILADEFNFHTVWWACIRIHERWGTPIIDAYNWTAETYCYWQLNISAVSSYWTFTLNLMPTFRFHPCFGVPTVRYPSCTFHAATHQWYVLFSFCTAVMDYYGVEWVECG